MVVKVLWVVLSTGAVKVSGVDRWEVLGSPSRIMFDNTSAATDDFGWI